MTKTTLTIILDIVDKIMDFFGVGNKLLRLKRKERILRERIKQAYQDGDEDRLTALYHSLKRVRAQIRDIEELK